MSRTWGLARAVAAACLAVFLVQSGCAPREASQPRWGSRSLRKELVTVKVGQHPQSFERAVTKVVGCQFLLYLPRNYGQEEKRWPLLLFLHGAGERGDDLKLVEIHGPPKLIAQGRDYPFIIVSPQCPVGVWWSLDVLNALLDEIVASYAVDEDRVYVTGLSMGGFGTWSLASERPERFAAIAPVCGGGNPLQTDRLKDVPAWVFHGAKDSVVPPKRSQEMVEALKKAGGEVELTLYPEAQHDSWTATYDNPRLYEWLLKHTRRQREGS